MEKNKIIICIICVILLVFLFGLIVKLKNNSKYSPDINAPIEKIEEIKKDTGATADSELYAVAQEYDGRQVLVIKPEIQFRTVLAGILKNGEPSTQDVENLNLNIFSKSGIWISENSRNEFLEILEKCNIKNFTIDDDGYLKQLEKTENQYSLKLEELIQSNQLTIIDITGRCYIRDEMSGEIIEYPFKDMDSDQVCEKMQNENAQIIVITTNEVNRIDILDEICN